MERKYRLLGYIGLPGYFAFATSATMAAVTHFWGWGHWVVAAGLMALAVACPMIAQRSLVRGGVLAMARTTRELAAN